MASSGDIHGFFLAGLLFLAAVAGRSVCNIGFIERPLVIGFVWWFCTGEYAPALPLAVFFELFWLDLFHIGGYIPPMGVFPYLLLLFLSDRFGWATPAAFAFPLAVTLPLAYLMSYAESRQRDCQKEASSMLLRHAQRNSPLGALPAQRIAVSIFQQIIIALFLFTAAAGTSTAIFSSAEEVGKRAAAAVSAEAGWSVFYVIAAIGALLSLRIKRAYIVFALCVTALLLLKFTS